MSSNKKRKPNYPRIIGCALGLIIVVVVVIIIAKLLIWNKGVKMILPENVILEAETEDMITLIPPDDYRAKDPSRPASDGMTTILILGNDTYAPDEDEDIFTSTLSMDLGCKVINCCIPGTFQTTLTPDASAAIDMFSLAKLKEGICAKDFSLQKNAVLSLPEELDRTRFNDVITTLEATNFDDVDIFIFAYDGHDFLTGCMDVGETVTDTTSMQGSIGATMTGFPETYPGAQFVYATPNFCYYTKDDGTRIGCDILSFGEEGKNLPTMLTFTRLLTDYYPFSYFDLFYGVDINTDTADQYLIEDDVVPTKEGRQMIADRLSALFKKALF